MHPDFKIPRDWEGMLTSKNADRIAERMLEILDNTTYSVVVVNEMYGFEPEIRTNQRLHRESSHPNPIKVSKFTAEHTGISISDSYGIWSFNSRIESDLYDREVKQQTLIRLSYDSVMIKQRVSAGHIVMWLFKVESKK